MHHYFLYFTPWPKVPSQKISLKALVACERNHCGCMQLLGVAKSGTRLKDFTFTFHFHALEKEMATHSRVLALRIPGTGEPGGLPSLGLHRVGHDWSDLAAAVIVMTKKDFFFPSNYKVLFIINSFSSHNILMKEVLLLFSFTRNPRHREKWSSLAWGHTAC